jgi:hypothetical protein
VSAAAEYCGFSDLPVVSCAHCKGIREPQSAGAAELGPWFRAAFVGDCAGCGWGIDKGDRIRGNGQGGYLCESCGGQT